MFLSRSPVSKVLWRLDSLSGVRRCWHTIPVCSPQVLHCCVCGSSTYTQQSHYTLTLADLSSTDYDPFLPLANVRNSEPVQYHSSADLGNLLTVEEGAYVYKYTILWAGRGKIVVLSMLVLNLLVEVPVYRVSEGKLPSLLLPLYSCYFFLLSSFSHLKLFTWFCITENLLPHTHRMQKKKGGLLFQSSRSFTFGGRDRTILGW